MADIQRHCPTCHKGWTICHNLEYAQQMAAHESARTTKLYDRRNDQVTLDQVERIVL
jgi:hypothetical protein